MKKLLLFCCIILLAACQKEDYFRFTDSSVSGISLDEKGGSEFLSYETNTDWMASSDADWIILSPKSGKAGTGSISVNVQPNTGYDGRSGRITITAGAVTSNISVTQTEGKGLVVGETSFNVGKEESTIEVKVQANVDYKVELLETAAEWISIVSGPDTKGLSPSTVILKVAENNTYDDRTGKLKIYADGMESIITVNQTRVPYSSFENTPIDPVSYIGGTVNIDLKSNMPIEAIIPAEAQSWISALQTKSISDHTLTLTLEKNMGFDRKVKIDMICGDDIYPIEICQDGVKDILMDLYRSTNGDSWDSRFGDQTYSLSNWGTEEPVEKWYGIGFIDGLMYIRLDDANLSGTLPASLGKLKNVGWLHLGGTFGGCIPPEWGEMDVRRLNLNSRNLTGPIPSELGNIANLNYLTIRGKFYSPIPASFGKLKNLEYLDITDCELNGSIPSEIGELENLTYVNLSKNKLSGKIPASLGKLKKLEFLALDENELKGEIPVEVLKSDFWTENADKIVCQNGYTLIPPQEYAQLRDITNEDLNGVPQSTHKLAKKNKYTILIIHAYDCPWSIAYMPVVIEAYKKFKDRGLGVIAFEVSFGNDMDMITDYVRESGISDFDNLLTYTYSSERGYDEHYGTHLSTPGVYVVDNDFRILFGKGEDRFTLPDFLNRLFGEDAYISKDYSKDGQVITMQKASKGEGINLVLMGDGFTDKDMDAGGVYEQRMQEAMDAYFSVEPVRSFRDRFNVYMVKAVSKNEGIGTDRETVFSSSFGEGTHIEGDNMKCFEYAMKVPSISSSENLSVVTVLNSTKYAGTCHMFSDGGSVAYVPYVSNYAPLFRKFICHEAVGHGFGKLSDEYVENINSIPSDAKDVLLMAQSLGWFQNVDITNDPATILWSDFLKNSSYKGNVGIYEGGYTYAHGVWRPTQGSIMNENNDGDEFNAPSRRVIYKKIFELSGESYSEEEFLEYDRWNIRSVNSNAPARSAKKKQDFVPSAPPVIHWK